MATNYQSPKYKKFAKDWEDFVQPHAWGDPPQFNTKLIIQYAFMAYMNYDRQSIISPVCDNDEIVISRYINTNMVANEEAVANTDKLIDYYKPLLFKIIDNSISEYDKTLYTIINNEICTAQDFKFISSLPYLYFNSLVFDAYNESNKTSVFLGNFGDYFGNLKLHILDVKTFNGISNSVSIYIGSCYDSLVTFYVDDFCEDPTFEYKHIKAGSNISIDGTIVGKGEYVYYDGIIINTVLTNVHIH